MPFSGGGVVQRYPAGVLAPLDYQPTSVGFFDFLLLLPEQSGFVLQQRVPEFVISNAGRSIHPQSVFDNSEAHIPSAQVFDQSRCIQTSNSTRSFSDTGCDSPPASTAAPAACPLGTTSCWLSSKY